MQGIGGLFELLILATAAAAILYYGALGLWVLVETAYYKLRGSNNRAVRRYYGVGPRK
jgi:hypothetical protein